MCLFAFMMYRPFRSYCKERKLRRKIARVIAEIKKILVDFSLLVESRMLFQVFQVSILAPSA